MEDIIEFLGRDLALDMQMIDDLAQNGQITLIKIIAEHQTIPDPTKKYAESKKGEAAEVITNGRIFDGLEMIEAISAVNDSSIRRGLRTEILKKLRARINTLSAEYDRMVGECTGTMKGSSTELVQKLDPCKYRADTIQQALNSLKLKMDRMEMVLSKRSGIRVVKEKKNIAKSG